MCVREIWKFSVYTMHKIKIQVLKYFKEEFKTIHRVLKSFIAIVINGPVL